MAAMRNTTVVMLMVGGLFVVSLAHAVVVAQSPTAASEGVFTAEQAKRGEAVYKENCSACHGDNLEGSGPMPPLAGQDFLANWKDKPISDLFEKIQTSMPATAPGTLTPVQTADVIAHILSAGKYPAGTKELEGKTEPLLLIKLDAPK